MFQPRVFISYAYDSERHKQQVREFAWFLRAEGGIDVRFDLWEADQRRDWSVWIVEQVRTADFVLVVASPTYKHRADGDAEPAEERGVQFEAALLRDLLTQDRDTWVHKVLPVVLPGRSIEEIPVFLQPHAASRYVVACLTIDGIDELYRVITRQPRHRPPGLGQLVVLDQTCDERGEGCPVDAQFAANRVLRGGRAEDPRLPLHPKDDSLVQLGDGRFPPPPSESIIAARTSGGPCPSS